VEVLKSGQVGPVLHGEAEPVVTEGPALVAEPQFRSVRKPVAAPRPHVAVESPRRRGPERYRATLAALPPPHDRNPLHNVHVRDLQGHHLAFDWYWGQPFATRALRCHHYANTREGRQIFVDVLMRFAEQNKNPRLEQVISRLAAPPRVAVLGRPGVGRRTVTAALAAAGLAITPDVVAADVHVLASAETLKP
jgi:hypothetical protein